LVDRSTCARATPHSTGALPPAGAEAARVDLAAP